VYICCSVTADIHALATYLPSYDQQPLSLYLYKFMTVLITGVYFSQVKNIKIKHDTHEFILDSGTVANTSIVRHGEVSTNSCVGSCLVGYLYYLACLYCVNTKIAHKYQYQPWVCRLK
jgi:hypothetical protein